MSEYEWIGGLKVGDPVVVEYGLVHTTKRIATVEKVTGTQIVAAGLRFRKEDGRVKGQDKYSRTRLLEPKTKLVCDIRRRDLANKIHDRDLMLLSLEQLETIHQMVVDAKAKQPVIQETV